MKKSTSPKCISLEHQSPERLRELLYAASSAEGIQLVYRDLKGFDERSQPNRYLQHWLRVIRSLVVVPDSLRTGSWNEFEFALAQLVTQYVYLEKTTKALQQLNLRNEVDHECREKSEAVVFPVWKAPEPIATKRKAPVRKGDGSPRKGPKKKRKKVSKD